MRELAVIHHNSLIEYAEPCSPPFCSEETQDKRRKSIASALRNHMEALKNA